VEEWARRAFSSDCDLSHRYVPTAGASHNTTMAEGQTVDRVQRDSERRQ
jgi:hypothetical protein